MAIAPPCAVVIFGASGDLARRKLVPAIYDLVREGLCDDRTCFVGFSRTDMSDQQFRAEWRDAIAKFSRSRPIDEGVWKKLEARIYYARGEYGSADDYARLADMLPKLDEKHGTGGNRLYYLATPPGQFPVIIERLGEPGRRTAADAFARVIIEKPFGRDLASAQAMNQLLHRYFPEEQIFRIDHYLGKETVQNLLVMRFANSVFEPIWNYKYIDHVQITVAESLGVENRGGYYDRAGALRDIAQNHMLQLMALVAMEPPVALDALSIRDEKVKVYRSIRLIRPAAVKDFTVRGQYAAGAYDPQRTKAYLREKGVAADSRTETFAAVKLFVDNWRWSGMPFYLRTGKLLKEKLSEVVVRFRSPPLTLFQKQCQSPVYPNDLVIRVQPNEGISWRLNGKVPGGQMMIKPVALDFLYGTTFHREPPDAYERLIHDAMIGDQTLFIRADEAEAAWAVIDPIEKGWAEAMDTPEPYEPGSWGPKGAMRLIEIDGRRWMHTMDGVDEPIIACSL
ncbi:MAG: glucose-6-phosphate dehydrogenase [Planctomycetota bacterium]|nr:glucose-6-phosphate dehydrogenase [Planctomycetota bacterium]